MWLNPTCFIGTDGLNLHGANLGSKMFRLWLRTTFELKEDNVVFFSLFCFYCSWFICFMLLPGFFKAKDQILLLKRQKKKTCYISTCFIFP